MEIFILTESTPHEGDAVLGAYSTKELAEAAKGWYEAKNPNHVNAWSYEIEPVPLDKIDN